MALHLADHEPQAHSSQRLDILILGPVPPPFGGISMHVERVVPLLRAAGFEVGVLNHFSSNEGPCVLGALRRNPLRYYFVPRRIPACLVHYHHSRWLNLVAVALGRKGSPARYIATFHGRRVLKYLPSDSTNRVLASTLTRWALRRFDTVIVVNEEVASVLRSRLEGTRIEVIPAFVESSRGESAAYDADGVLEAFLRSGRVLVASAYRVHVLADGTDLYGLDLAVDAVARLASEHDLRLALFIASRPRRRRARRYLAALEHRMERVGLRDRLHIAFGAPLVPALRENVIFVRPTRADGDALSIREAQRAAVPVIASDVVQRPPGVVLFQSGDKTAFCSAVRTLVSSEWRALPVEDGAVPGAPSFSELLIDLYRDELACQRRDVDALAPRRGSA